MQSKTGSWNMKVECSEELTRNKDHLCIVTEFLMSCIVSKSYKSTLVVANITNCLLLNAILKKSLFNGRINLSTYCLAWLLNLRRVFARFNLSQVQQETEYFQQKRVCKWQQFGFTNTWATEMFNVMRDYLGVRWMQQNTSLFMAATKTHPL